MCVSVDQVIGSQLLQVTWEQDGWTVVGVDGEIDLHTAPGLHADLQRAVNGTTRLVLDLSAVTFLDCAALRALVAVHDVARAGGGSFRIVTTAPIVLKLLRLTCLDTVLEVYPALPAALSASVWGTTPAVPPRR